MPSNSTHEFKSTMWWVGIMKGNVSRFEKITSTKQIVKIGKRELQQVLGHFLG